MRWIDILDEHIDTSIYGVWFDSNTGLPYNIYQQMDHTRWLRSHLNEIPSLAKKSKEIIDKIQSLSQDDFDNFEDDKILYDYAYKAGLIKITNPTNFTGYEMLVCGYRNNIKNAMAWIWVDIKYFYGSLYITFYNGLNSTDKELKFKMPQDITEVEHILL